MASQLEHSIDALAASRDEHLLGQLDARHRKREPARSAERQSVAGARIPSALGSALTHPLITTDFCESQPELITGVHHSVEGCLDELSDIHRFVYRTLDDELLWSSSMPCMLGSGRSGTDRATTGTSNVGRTKTHLSPRLERALRPPDADDLRHPLQLLDSRTHCGRSSRRFREPVDSRAFRDDAYFSLIRNFRRHSWLLIYLFGASPSLCKSFVKGKPHTLESFDEGSLFVPHGTSLRMGGLGYRAMRRSNLHISYNSLAAIRAHRCSMR